MKMLMLFWYTPSSDQNCADYVNGHCSICSCSTNWLPWWYTKHNLPMLFPQLGCLPHPWANQSGEIGQCLKPSWLHASIIIIPVPLSQVQRCLSVNPITYWMAALIWDTVVSLVFVTIAACIIQAFQVTAPTFTHQHCHEYSFSLFGFVKMLSFIWQNLHQSALSQVPSYTSGANFPASLLLMLLFCQARCWNQFLINSNWT